MKLLVEIPDYRYKAIKEIDVTQKHYTINERSAITVIKNGQPLPKDCEILTKEAYADLCMRASKGQEPNCSGIPTGSTAKIDVPDNNVGNIDCISRSDAIKAIQKYGVGCLDADDFSPEQCERYVISKLNALPSVTPQEPRWILVSEKLPEPFMFVNATCRSLVDDREDWVIETLYLPIPKEANKHGYSDWGNIPMLNCGDAEVIAWVKRIIPEPYKAGK